MKNYIRAELPVKAEMWGPTWERMKKTARELPEHGISFKFDDDDDVVFDEKEEYGLPQLYIFTDRWDKIKVRVGDYIVITGYRQVAVVPKNEFRAEYTELAEPC